MWTFTSTARRSGDFIKAAGQTLPAGRDTVNGLPVHRFGFVEFPPAVRRVMDATSHLWSTRQWPGYGKVKAWWVGPHMRGLVRAAVRLRPNLIAATAAPFLPLWDAARAASLARVPLAIMPCLHPGDRWLGDNPSLVRLLRRADAVMALTVYEKRMLQALCVDGSSGRRRRRRRRRRRAARRGRRPPQDPRHPGRRVAGPVLRSQGAGQRRSRDHRSDGSLVAAGLVRSPCARGRSDGVFDLSPAPVHRSHSRGMARQGGGA